MPDVTVNQNFPNAKITITDTAGNPANVDGVPVWASSDETVLVAVPAADGMTGLVDTVGQAAPLTSLLRQTPIWARGLSLWSSCFPTSM